MALTRFVHLRVVFSGADEVTRSWDPGGDCAIQVVEKDGSRPRAFTLRGHADKGLFPAALREVDHDAECGRVSWIATLTTEESERLVELAQTVSVPVLPPARPPGMDGTWYHFSLSHGSGGFELRWWVDVPEGWEGIGEITDHLWRVAERTLASPATRRMDLPPRRAITREFDAIPSRPWWRPWG